VIASAESQTPTPDRKEAADETSSPQCQANESAIRRALAVAGGSPCAIVGGGFDAVIDVEDEPRHFVVPVEPHHRLRRQPAATARVERCGHSGGQLVDVVQHRLKDPGRRNDAFGDAFGESGDGRLFAMDEKKPALNWAASGDPPRQLRSVGMSGIIVVDGAMVAATLISLP
jgi:hypothetical protein